MQGASFIYTCPASIHMIGNVYEWRPIADRKKGIGRAYQTPRQIILPLSDDFQSLKKEL
jgi:hypothetical protein